MKPILCIGGKLDGYQHPPLTNNPKRIKYPDRNGRVVGHYERTKEQSKDRIIYRFKKGF